MAASPERAEAFLAELQRRIDATRREIESLERRRYRAWDEAMDAGVTQQRLADLAGLTLAGVKKAIETARWRGWMQPPRSRAGGPERLPE